MADNNLTDDELALFFEAAKTDPETEVSAELMARVLTDAADIGAGYITDSISAAVEKKPWLTRLFAPIGGVGGAFALGAFASVGLFVGLGDVETLYSLPVMGDILATISSDFESTTSLDTLDYLMAES